MDRQNFLLISERPDDARFFSLIAQAMNANFLHTKSWTDLVRFLGAFPKTTIFWDADHKGNVNPNHPSVLVKCIAPHNVVAVSDKLISEIPALANNFLKAFNHNFLRRYDKSSLHAYVKLLQFSNSSQAFNFSHFFVDKVQEVQIGKTEHKRAAVEAVQSFFTKKGLDERISAKAAQATDELLMNAIFDAPVDALGNRTRHDLDRKYHFELDPEEKVRLEIGATEDYVGICVSDIFGSVNKENTFRFLNQDFRGKDYKVPKDTGGSGLGYYGVLKSGLSVLISCIPRVKTRAMIFFPKTDSFKKFKESFQFVSYF